MHPVWRRCSSVEYCPYAPSSRLASRAPRRPKTGTYSCADPKIRASFQARLLTSDCHRLILPSSSVGKSLIPGSPLTLLQGTLDLLILQTLSVGPNHGYGVSTRQLPHHPATHRRDVGGRRRRPLSRPAPPGAPAPGDRRVGPVGEQPQGEVLPADPSGPPAAAGRVGEVGAIRGRRLQGAEAGLGSTRGFDASTPSLLSVSMAHEPADR